MYTLFRLGYAVAIVLVCAAVGLWVIPARISNRFTAPFECPFPIVSGEATTLSFIPPLAEKYYIGVEVDRNLPAARLDHIIGFPPTESALRPKIDFSLETQEHQVATSPSRGSWWSGLYLGTFRAAPGVKYALHASVQHADQDWRSLNGRLFVSVDPLVAEGYYYSVWFARFYAVVASALAAFVAGMSAFAIRVRRYVLAPQTT